MRELLKADSDWAWGSIQQRAFEELRQELSSPTVLDQYSPNSATKVAADTSSFGLGGALSQKQLSGEWRPVAFISRSMTSKVRVRTNRERGAGANLGMWAPPIILDRDGLSHTNIPQVSHFPTGQQSP